MHRGIKLSHKIDHSIVSTLKLPMKLSNSSKCDVYNAWTILMSMTRSIERRLNDEATDIDNCENILIYFIEITIKALKCMIKNTEI